MIGLHIHIQADFCTGADKLWVIHMDNYLQLLHLDERIPKLFIYFFSHPLFLRKLLKCNQLKEAIKYAINTTSIVDTDPTS